MSPVPPAGAPTRVKVVRGVTVGLVFLLGAVVGLGLAWAWLPCASDRPAPALVDARLPLRSEGAFFPFTLTGPAEVTVEVELPAMLDGEVIVGPLYAAMRPDLVYEADAGDDVRYAVHGCGSEPWRQRFEKPGAYAVRIPAIPTAMGMEAEMFVTVRVTARYAAP